MAHFGLSGSCLPLVASVSPSVDSGGWVNPLVSCEEVGAGSRFRQYHVQVLCAKLFNFSKSAVSTSVK